MLFEVGDIISAKRANQIVTHKGIFLTINNKGYIMHAARLTRNVYGGNLVIEPMEIFFSTRKFISRMPTELTNDEIINYALKNINVKFDYLTQNCEHFVYGCLNKRHSPQLVGYSILGIFILYLLIHLQKKSK